MKKSTAVVLTSILLLLAGIAAGQEPQKRSTTVPRATPAPSGPGEMEIEAQNKLVSSYCASCHNEKMKPGGLSLADFDASKAVKNAAVTEKIIRKLRAGMMPPPQAPRPDA